MNINKFNQLLKIAYEVTAKTLTPITYKETIARTQQFLNMHGINVTEKQTRLFLIDYQLKRGMINNDYQ